MGRLIYVNGTHQTVAPAHRTPTPYATTIRSLSDRLVEASRPIRVLDAVRWDDRVEADFFASDGRELPRVTRDYYGDRPLSFDPDRKREEYLELERDVRRQLGDDNPAGRLLARRCQEGRSVVDLVAQRGTPAFATTSSQLYGSTADCCHEGGPPLALFGQTLGHPIRDDASDASEIEEAEVSAAEAVGDLSNRLTTFFSGAPPVRVRLSDDIAADATAGTDYIKVRGDARFTVREVRLLEVHEGWVHLGTTLNAQTQPTCTFLTKGTPSSTITQEGLAVLTEVLALASHPARVRRLTHRVEAVALAEAGANFLDVYRFYLEQGYDPREAYQHTTRVFRGSLPEDCGPFTKDLSYAKGFVLVSKFVRAALSAGQAELIPLLFCGKTSLVEIPDLAELAEDGLLLPPRYLPPPFADLKMLSAWTMGGDSWEAFQPIPSPAGASGPNYSPRSAQRIAEENEKKSSQRVAQDHSIIRI